MLPLSKLSGSGRTCQERAFGVGFADLRLLTDPARSPGVRSYREHGQERPGSISGHQKCLQAVTSEAPSQPELGDRKILV